MAIVNNQSELQAAIAAHDSFIQVDTDITLTARLVIRYAVVISSIDSANVRTIFKGESFFGNMFSITNCGALTLRNIILDGNAGKHPNDNSTNRSAVLLAGGTLTLETGAVIQNNNAPPIITPTAKSSTFPRIMNSLNSPIIFFIIQPPF